MSCIDFNKNLLVLPMVWHPTHGWTSLAMVGHIRYPRPPDNRRWRNLDCRVHRRLRPSLHVPYFAGSFLHCRDPEPPWWNRSPALNNCFLKLGSIFITSQETLTIVHRRVFNNGRNTSPFIFERQGNRDTKIITVTSLNDRENLTIDFFEQ